MQHSLALTLGAKIRRALVENNFGDRRATLVTRQSLTGVNLQEVLVLAALAIRIDEPLVGERRPTVLDRLGQDFGDSAVQSANLDGGQRLRDAVVHEPGIEKDLVGIDVANARDDLLVRQQGLK